MKKQKLLLSKNKAPMVELFIWRACLTMVITAIEEQKKKDRFNIFIDYEYSFSACYDDIVEFNVKVGDTFDEEGKRELIYKCQYNKALNAAFNFLSNRPRTEYEVRKRIMKLDIDDEIIEKVIQRLKELKLIDDKEYAKMWLDERSRLKPEGKNKLVLGLKNKGIKPQIIDECMSEWEYDDYSVAMKLLQKKLANKDISLLYENKPLYNKEIQRLYRYLLYRGIGYDTANRALKAYLEKSEDI